MPLRLDPRGSCLRLLPAAFGPCSSIYPALGDPAAFRDNETVAPKSLGEEYIGNTRESPTAKLQRFAIMKADSKSQGNPPEESVTVFQIEVTSHKFGSQTRRKVRISGCPSMRISKYPKCPQDPDQPRQCVQRGTVSVTRACYRGRPSRDTLRSELFSRTRGSAS